MRHLEDTLQTMCVSWFDMQYPSKKRLLHHSPNGGKRNAREGARFKAMGVRAGVADLMLLIPTPSHPALFIELKSAKGKQQESQREWQRLVEDQGYRYEVCRSLEEFIELITDYLKDGKANNHQIKTN